ncbi:hypothetical protein L486_05966 [Kwoniella mangroviensis CBS 10435]|uniref:RNase III domain-containing protein n=1 Tax=Kwoniella mangroviensis CBS 10435 TaxID=1331196 RepID=A0A1B9INJ7_9TREE|nr:hypothetical protein L486_05966 [Kwoniella mangroviensis CBS 10435]
MRYDTHENNPLFSYVLPPVPAFPLPPLPRIIDTDLYEQVISHVSIQCLTRRSVMALAKPEEDWEKAVDYEKLEHLGDAILENVATGLIHEEPPWLRQGGSAIIRDYLVSNATLAQLSVMYNLPLLIKADPSSILYVRSSEKIQASVLEAWIAGTYYSYLKYGEGGGISIDHEGEISTSQRTMTDTRQVEIAIESREELIEDTVQYEEDEDEERPPKNLRPVLEPIRSCLSIDTDPKVGEVMKKRDEVSHTTDLENLISTMMIASTSSRSTTVVPATTASSTEISKIPAPGSEGLVATGIDNQSRGLPNDAEIQPSQLQPPSQLYSVPISGTYAEEPQSPLISPRTKGQAFDYIHSWLQPLLTPYCRWIYTLLLKEQNKILSTLPPDVPKLVIPDHWKEEDRKSMGMPQALSQHPWIKSVGNKPVYVKEPKLGQRWKVTCKVVDLDGKEWLGEAIRPNAQAAKNVAAWMVYRQLGQ